VDKKEGIEELKAQLTKASEHIELKGAVVSTPKSKEQIEAEQSIQEWKGKKNKQNHIKAFELPKHLIKVLLSTHEHFGLIFYGEGGVGKTVLTISTAKTSLKSDEWEYSNGYTTPLALYEFLHKNRNKKLIILDDVEGVFNNNLSMSILKGALWDSDGKRIVQYNTKSNRATDLPSAFIMESKLIILCNKIPNGQDIGTRAMISRTIPFELTFSYKDKLRICEVFLNHNDTLNSRQKAEVLKLLKEKTSEATKDFNFRTLKKAIAYIKYDRSKAESLFCATVEEDELKKVYLESKGMGDTITDQCRYFMRNTGMSRRTYFRVKKELSAKVSSKKDMALDTKRGKL
jgi:DNA polymerase III delta prime subunit